MNKILSTGNLNQAYDVIDVVFAFDSHKEGFFTGLSPDKAFDGVKEKLRNKCLELAGDAVINCQFEYRNALTDGIGKKKQIIEILAYGTVVRFK